MGKINVLKMKWHDKNAIISRAIASKSFNVPQARKGYFNLTPKSPLGYGNLDAPQVRKHYFNLDVMDGFIKVDKDSRYG